MRPQGQSRRAARAAVLGVVVLLPAACSFPPAVETAPSRATVTAPASGRTTGSQQNAPAPGVEREQELQALLRDRAAAVLARDRERFAATLDSPRSGFGLRQLELFEALARLPLGTFEYGTPEVAPALSTERAAQVGPQAWVARVRGRYTLKGYDRAPRAFETHLTAVRRTSGWRLADDSDGGTQTQLWDLPDLRVLRSPTTLVVGSGAVPDLESYLRLGDAAVRSVGGVWDAPWGSRLVLVVPATTAEMAAQLGHESAQVEQVAAVTDGSVDTDGRAGADRVVVNPQAFARLQPSGQQVVVTHETAHVAVRASTDRPVPLWLSEGMADYIGYRGVDLGRSRVAAELLAQVRAGTGPRTLPGERDFDPATATIAPSYNAAWLAVSLIADEHGEDTLVRFYRHAATGAGAGGPGDPDANTEDAFAEVLGTTTDAFTQRWLAHLDRLAGP